MRRSRAETERTHSRIVERAAVLFREHGVEGIGLAGLMQEAGLTHGGFYRHFTSKDGLVAEACTHALEESVRRMRRRAERHPDAPLQAVIEGFLSADHVGDAGRGCAVAALGSDIFRCGPATREAFTRGVAELITLMAELQPQDDARARRDAAIASFAGMLGAVIMARGVSDPGLRRELLESMRRHLPATPRPAQKAVAKSSRGRRKGDAHAS
jgi:TetR/AcrR family transcriptional repressor of nem operon